MDTLLDAREEIKDLHAKIARFQKELFELNAQIDLVKRGKMSASKLPSSAEAEQWAKLRGEPKTPMQGVFC